MPFPDLWTRPPHTRRLVLACCALSQDTPLTKSQQQTLLAALRDRAWVPTAATCPVPVPVVGAWYAGLTAKRRALMDPTREEVPHA